MERWATLLGVVAAGLAGIFQIISQMENAVPLLVIAAILLIGIGSLTGK